MSESIYVCSRLFIATLYVTAKYQKQTNIYTEPVQSNLVYSNDGILKRCEREWETISEMDGMISNIL